MTVVFSNETVNANEVTLGAAGDDIRVLISSYSETAEDENTASSSAL